MERRASPHRSDTGMAMNARKHFDDPQETVRSCDVVFWDLLLIPIKFPSDFDTRWHQTFLNVLTMVWGLACPHRRWSNTETKPTLGGIFFEGPMAVQVNDCCQHENNAKLVKAQRLPGHTSPKHCNWQLSTQTIFPHNCENWTSVVEYRHFSYLFVNVFSPDCIRGLVVALAEPKKQSHQSQKLQKRTKRRRKRRRNPRWKCRAWMSLAFQS